MTHIVEIPVIEEHNDSIVYVLQSNGNLQAEIADLVSKTSFVDTERYVHVLQNGQHVSQAQTYKIEFRDVHMDGDVWTVVSVTKTEI